MNKNIAVSAQFWATIIVSTIFVLVLAMPAVPVFSAGFSEAAPGDSAYAAEALLRVDAAGSGSAIVDAPPDPFGDVPASHWAREDVDELRKMGFTIGFPDGFFKGDAGLSRFEFAALLNRLMKADRANSVVLMKRSDFASLIDLVRRTVEIADRARAEADRANRRLDERFGPDQRQAGARAAASRAGRKERTRPSLWADDAAGRANHGKAIRRDDDGGRSRRDDSGQGRTRPKMRWLKEHDFR